jgi:hypothetical protein
MAALGRPFSLMTHESTFAASIGRNLLGWGDLQGVMLPELAIIYNHRMQLTIIANHYTTLGS